MAKPKGPRKILFVGGGTLGPVTPLLAVIEAWRAHDPLATFVWVGTPDGPERTLIEQAGIPFFSLAKARLTRYPSVEWVLLPFRLIQSAVQSAAILLREKPSLIASAGGYTAVPIVYVGRLLGVRSWVHHSDVRVTLTTKLTAPIASVVTTAWEENRAELPAGKTTVVGNPVRASLKDGRADRAVKQFGLNPDRMTVLVLGGGGGSAWINQAMAQIGVSLAQTANVVHVTGKGKLEETLTQISPTYHALEIVTAEMADLLAVADVVVCRAGMGTLSELSAFQRAGIVIPLPHSPQEDNVRVLLAADAAIVLDQSETSPQALLGAITALLDDAKRRKVLGAHLQALLPTDVADQILALVET